MQSRSALIVVLFAVSACSNQQAVRPTPVVAGGQRVTGEIHDSWDGKPIALASIAIGGRVVATTDERGAFASDGIAIGKHKVEIVTPGEAFVLDGAAVHADGRSSWRIGLPTKSCLAAMEQATGRQDIALAKVKGWLALQPQVELSPDVATVKEHWPALVEEYRQATTRSAKDHSIEPFASIVPGGSRMAALVAYLLATNAFGPGGAAEMPAPGPGLLLADMLHMMEVVAARPSVDFPFGIDVFLTDDRLAPPPDLDHLTRQNTPSVLVSEVGGRLVIGAISPALSAALENAWRSALLTGSPWRTREESAGPGPTLFERMAKQHAFDDLICLRCEDLLTEAIVAKHLRGWTEVKTSDPGSACRLACKRRLGDETVSITADCGLKNEVARRYDSNERRVQDDPLVETEKGAGGDEVYAQVTVSDNDTPCLFSVTRSGHGRQDPTPPARALAKDIAELATPALLGRKKYEVVVVDESDGAKLPELRPVLDAIAPLAAGLPRSVDDKTQPGLPAGTKGLLLATCPNGRGSALVELLSPLLPSITFHRIAGDKPVLACPLGGSSQTVGGKQEAFPRRGGLQLHMMRVEDASFLSHSMPEAELVPGAIGRAVVFLVDDKGHLVDWKALDLPGAAQPARKSSRSTRERSCFLQGTGTADSLKLELTCTLEHIVYCADNGTDKTVHTVRIRGRKIAIDSKFSSTPPTQCEHPVEGMEGDTGEEE